MFTELFKTIFDLISSLTGGIGEEILLTALAGLNAALIICGFLFAGCGYGKAKKKLNKAAKDGAAFSGDPVMLFTKPKSGLWVVLALILFALGTIVVSLDIAALLLAVVLLTRLIAGLITKAKYKKAAAALENYLAADFGYEQEAPQEESPADTAPEAVVETAPLIEEENGEEEETDEITDEEIEEEENREQEYEEENEQEPEVEEAKPVRQEEQKAEEKLYRDHALEAERLKARHAQKAEEKPQEKHEEEKPAAKNEEIVPTRYSAVFAQPKTVYGQKPQTQQAQQTQKEPKKEPAPVLERAPTYAVPTRVEREPLTPKSSIDGIIERINVIKREGATEQTMTDLVHLIQREREKPENKNPEQRRRLSAALSDLLKTMNNLR